MTYGTFCDFCKTVLGDVNSTHLELNEITHKYTGDLLVRSLTHSQHFCNLICLRSELESRVDSLTLEGPPRIQ